MSNNTPHSSQNPLNLFKGVHRNRQLFFTGFLVLGLFIAVLVVNSPQDIRRSAADSGDGVTLAITDAQRLATTGEEFNIVITAHPNGNALATLTLHVFSDPRIIQPQTVTANTGEVSSQTIEGNDATFTLTFPRPLDKQAAVATISYRAVGSGPTNITIDPTSEATTVGGTDITTTFVSPIALTVLSE